MVPIGSVNSANTAFTPYIFLETAFILIKKRKANFQAHHTGPPVNVGRSERSQIVETTDAYRKKAKARLDEIGAKIDQLKAKAVQADADARIQAEEQIDRLKQRKQEMQTRLDELKESGEAAFNEIKAGTEDALNSLKSAVDKAVSKFG